MRECSKHTMYADTLCADTFLVTFYNKVVFVNISCINNEQTSAALNNLVHSSIYRFFLKSNVVSVCISQCTKELCWHKLK